MKSHFQVLTLVCLVAFGSLVITGCNAKSGAPDKMSTGTMGGDKMGGDKMGGNKMSDDKMSDDKMGSDKMGEKKMK